MDDKKVRIKPIPDYKKKLVGEIAEKMKSFDTVLVASTKGLPASQFQKIKKGLRGKAEIVVAKKSIVNRALVATGKGSLVALKDQIGADVALIFSKIDAFELSGLLADNQSSSKAKAGDISPEDINVEPGPTDLIPGPAISELGSVGLKVAVEDGKLAIKQGATIVKAGEEINEKVASVMGKLNILPMKVGFIPLAAYDAKEDSVYTGIKIDKKSALEELRNAIGKAFGFAVNAGYAVKETISYLIGRAGLEAKALEMKVGSAEGEKKEEEPKSEDNAEQSSANQQNLEKNNESTGVKEEKKNE